MREGIYTAEGQPDVVILDGGNDTDGKQLPWIRWKLADEEGEGVKSLWYVVEEMLAAGRYEPGPRREKGAPR